MNHEELTAVRIFLDLGVDKEAAKLLSADDDHPEGVNRRSWQRWEKGESRIPDGIVKNVEEIKKRRAKLLAHHVEKKTTELKIPYEIKNSNPLEFKIQVSVIYELYMKGYIRILIA